MGNLTMSELGSRLAPYGARIMDTLFWTVLLGLLGMLFIPPIRDSYLVIPVTLLSAVVIGVIRQKMGWYSERGMGDLYLYD